MNERINTVLASWVDCLQRNFIVRCFRIYYDESHRACKRIRRQYSGEPKNAHVHELHNANADFVHMSYWMLYIIGAIVAFAV